MQRLEPIAGSASKQGAAPEIANRFREQLTTADSRRSDRA
jgi:hypothetical protein